MKAKKKDIYMNVVRQYNNYTLVEDSGERTDCTEFVRVKEELKEYIEKFLCMSQNEQRYGDILDKRRFEDKERYCSQLLHNINRELPVDEVLCKKVWIEYKTMILMPWRSYVTVPQFFVIAGVVMICLLVFFWR